VEGLRSSRSRRGGSMKRALVFPLLTLFTATIAWSEEKWELIKDKENVEIYTCDVPGEDIKN